MPASISDPTAASRVHFIGVGGSSMSGLAGTACADEGWTVTGSDRTRSHKTDALEAARAYRDSHRPAAGERAWRGRDRLSARPSRPENPERAEGCAAGHSRNRALRSDRSADGRFADTQSAFPARTVRPRRPRCSRRPFCTAGVRPDHPHRRRAGLHRRLHPARRQRAISSSRRANSIRQLPALPPHGRRRAEHRRRSSGLFPRSRPYRADISPNTSPSFRKTAGASHGATIRARGAFA